MPTLSSYTSTAGAHMRATATAGDPILLRNIRGGSTIVVACDANATAYIELSISAPDIEPIWAPAGASYVPAGSTVIDEIQSKLAAVRVTVEGAGSATVEVLQ